MNQKDQEFQQLIQNKNIIIVGPSPYLKDKNYGEWIDSFDYVVKFNNMIYSNQSQDHGSKIDILYLNNFYTRKQHFINSPNHDKVKMLVIKPIRDSQLYQIHNNLIKTRIVNQITSGLLLGIMSIKDILQFNPNNLHVIGMDFYQSDQLYYPNYQLLNHTDKHNINNNINHIKQVMNYNNLTFDSQVKNFLKKLN